MEWIKRLALVVVVAGGAFGYSMWSKASASKEALQSAYVRYAHVGSDEGGKKKIEAAHEASFGPAYKSAGRHRSAKFNQAKYEELMDQRLGSPNAIVPASANR